MPVVTYDVVSGSQFQANTWTSGDQQSPTVLGLNNGGFGLSGNDALDGGAGADRLDGGSGTDTANYSTSAAGVTVRLWNGTGQNGDAQGDVLTSIENATGSGLADSLIGANAIDNRLEGGGGDDFLAGLSGNDILDGGADDDQLTGGAGDDTFVFSAFDGSDVVTDFVAGPASGDAIQLADWGFAFDTFGEVIAAASQIGADVVTTFGNGQTLTMHDVILATLDAGDFIFGPWRLRRNNGVRSAAKLCQNENARWLAQHTAHHLEAFAFFQRSRNLNTCWCQFFKLGQVGRRPSVLLGGLPN